MKFWSKFIDLHSKDAFEYFVCEMVAMLPRPKYVNIVRFLHMRMVVAGTSHSDNSYDPYRREMHHT